LRKEIGIITGFYQQQPAYRVASDLGVDYQAVSRVYQQLREAIYHVAELEAGKLKGEIEIDEAYFGGRRKGKRGEEERWEKALYWGFWSETAGCIPKWWNR